MSIELFDLGRGEVHHFLVLGVDLELLVGGVDDNVVLFFAPLQECFQPFHDGAEEAVEAAFGVQLVLGQRFVEGAVHALEGERPPLGFAEALDVLHEGQPLLLGAFGNVEAVGVVLGQHLFKRGLGGLADHQWHNRSFCYCSCCRNVRSYQGGAVESSPHGFHRGFDAANHELAGAVHHAKAEAVDDEVDGTRLLVAFPDTPLGFVPLAFGDEQPGGLGEEHGFVGVPDVDGGFTVPAGFT